MSNDRKVVLITGVSSGIGRETAQLLAERGYKVFGSARNPRRVEAIPGVELVQLDVTDDASVLDTMHSVRWCAAYFRYGRWADPPTKDT